MGLHTTFSVLAVEGTFMGEFQQKSAVDRLVHTRLAVAYTLLLQVNVFRSLKHKSVIFLDVEDPSVLFSKGGETVGQEANSLTCLESK